MPERWRHEDRLGREPTFTLKGFRGYEQHKTQQCGQRWRDKSKYCSFQKEQRINCIRMANFLDVLCFPASKASKAFLRLSKPHYVYIRSWEPKSVRTRSRKGGLAYMIWFQVLQKGLCLLKAPYDTVVESCSESYNELLQIIRSVNACR